MSTKLKYISKEATEKIVTEESLGYCKTTKSFTGWKLVWEEHKEQETRLLVQLQIPKGAKINLRVTSSYRNKLRVDRAKVIALFEVTGNKGRRRQGGEVKAVGMSNEANEFLYKKRATVKPVYPFEESSEECESGIHFFLNKSKALAWLD